MRAIHLSTIVFVAALAVAILEQINTAAATDVLEQLAAGHPDAGPTKAAKASLERLLPIIDPFAPATDD